MEDNIDINMDTSIHGGVAVGRLVHSFSKPPPTELSTADCLRLVGFRSNSYGTSRTGTSWNHVLEQ